ncbi:MAG: YggS family pyridoxal phosphate enzyme [Bdellovibrionales bacterium GWA2_49_15]|nr:MAG: YggS family pyridoxal phosphate enzyme [Bdellovibrionales bacterium GWA2_49_15]HAZ13512.1 YggS family pyridoxal phosphate-dependent enzyme [Bdellovibrionales bacterium]
MLTEPKKKLISDALKDIRSHLGSSQLVAVTKHTGIEEMAYAYELGQRIFGENRVQDLVKKSEQLAGLPDLEWHFIGHLQRNKVKDVLKVERLSAIHSVDSLSLLEKIIECPQAARPLALFFEVNTSGEKEKWGFTDQEQLKLAFQKALKDGAPANLIPAGLMTMGTFRTKDAEGEAHRCFKELRKMKLDLEKSLGIKGLKLSMGMSGDYQIAVEHGADYVRIGSQIFG